MWDRVATIPYDSSAEYITELHKSLNGVLFTGGGASLLPDSTYFKAAKLLYGTHQISLPTLEFTFPT